MGAAFEPDGLHEDHAGHRVGIEREDEITAEAAVIVELAVELNGTGSDEAPAGQFAAEQRIKWVERARRFTVEGRDMVWQLDLPDRVACEDRGSAWKCEGALWRWLDRRELFEQGLDGRCLTSRDGLPLDASIGHVNADCSSFAVRRGG